MASTKHDKNVLARLAQLYRIAIDRRPGVPIPQALASTKAERALEGTLFTPQEWPAPARAAWNYWSIYCHERREDYADRMAAFDDVDTMFRNCSIMDKALRLTVSEAIQADANMQSISIEAPQDMKDHASRFLERIGYYNRLEWPTLFNQVKYGNFGWLLVLGSGRIKQVIPISAYEIQDRLEFQPHKVMEEMNRGGSALRQLSQLDRMNRLIKSIAEDADVASAFQPYLFGFQIGDFLVPPWRFIHFRWITDESPFDPFGTPYYLSALGPWRQYDAAMTMQMAARGARFPRDVYEINTAGHTQPTEKYKAIRDFIRKFVNISQGRSAKEDIAIGEAMAYPRDMAEYKQITPVIDIGKVDDLEMLYNDLIQATLLPRGWLDPTGGVAFGNSGIALSRQLIPLHRAVFQIQNRHLAGVAQALRIEFILSNKWKFSQIDKFLLSMPYPESQTDRDTIGARSDQIALAQSIVDLYQKTFSVDKLSQTAVRAILGLALPWDTKVLDKLADLTLASTPPVSVGEPGGGIEAGGAGAGGGMAPTELPAFPGEEEAPAEEEGAGAGLGLFAQSLRRSGKKISFKEAVGFATYAAKSAQINNGIFQGRHYWNGVIPDDAFDVEFLVDCKIAKAQEIAGLRPLLEASRDAGGIYWSEINERAEEVKFWFENVEIDPG